MIRVLRGAGESVDGVLRENGSLVIHSIGAGTFSFGPRGV